MAKLLILVLSYAATIPAANWLMTHVGTVCPVDGPCLIPVGFGLYAPSGVLMIGAALVLRDIVQLVGGTRAGLVAIAIGGVVSWFFAPPALVLASATAFLLSELADFAVYTPLRRRQLELAVLASGIVGSIIDSIVFLWLAFGSLAFIEGQIIGKAWMTLLAIPLIRIARKSLNPIGAA